jgi:hypothetical protein
VGLICAGFFGMIVKILRGGVPMLTSEQVLFLRSIKKTAVVLLVMGWLDQPVTAAQLSEILEISNNAARAYLRGLVRLGLVRHQPRDCSYALVSTAGELFFYLDDRKICDPSSSIKRLINLDSEPSETEESTGGRKKPACRKGSRKEAPEEAAPEAVDPQLAKALAKAGVMLTARTRKLASLPHVTAEYVRRHHQALEERGHGRSTGLLIRILEDGLPLPEVQEGGHLEGCRCADCQRRAYASWES